MTYSYYVLTPEGGFARGEEDEEYGSTYFRIID